MSVAAPAVLSHHPVLLLGEPGVGKLEVAQALHDLSRTDRPLSVFNAALALLDGFAVWLGRIRDRLGRRGTLVLTHLETLARTEALALMTLVRPLAVTRRQDAVGLQDLPPDLVCASQHGLTALQRLQLEAIMAALGKSGSNIKLAAAELGVSRSTLYRRLPELHIDLNDPARVPSGSRRSRGRSAAAVVCVLQHRRRSLEHHRHQQVNHDEAINRAHRKGGHDRHRRGG
jgi:hypothetical protein